MNTPSQIITDMPEAEYHARPEVSKHDLDRVLSYDPETGLFTWKVRVSNRIKIGDVAGAIRKDGYISISIEGRFYLAHRLAWLTTYGEMPDCDVDHRDTVRGNNRITNLRLATRSENLCNQGARKRSRIHPKGVYQVPSTKRWEAKIMRSGVTYRKGPFDSIEQAAAAAKELRQLHHGKFARN